MTPLHTAARMALDALEKIYDATPIDQTRYDLCKALRSALAAPMPEPVALMALDDINELMHCNGMSVFVENPRIYPPYCEGEPLVGFVPLYFAPPAAPAVPLTDKQINNIADALLDNGGCTVLTLARAIEQAHGIGGGGK